MLFRQTLIFLCVEERVYFGFYTYIELRSFRYYNTKSGLLSFVEITDEKGKWSARGKPSRHCVEINFDL